MYAISQGELLFWLAVIGIIGFIAVRSSRSRRLSAPAAPAGWYADPTGRFAQRHWDGSQWTQDVIDAQGAQSIDPPSAPA